MERWCVVCGVLALGEGRSGVEGGSRVGEGVALLGRSSRNFVFWNVFVSRSFVFSYHKFNCCILSCRLYICDMYCRSAVKISCSKHIIATAFQILSKFKNLVPTLFSLMPSLPISALAVSNYWAQAAMYETKGQEYSSYTKEVVA
jgi:hypothetical protein